MSLHFKEIYDLGDRGDRPTEVGKRYAFYRQRSAELKT